MLGCAGELNTLGSINVRYCIAISTIVCSANAYAGAWGAGSFENDDALDWVMDCARAKSPKLVTKAFSLVLTGRPFETPEASAAVAAAEAIASALGRPNPQAPAEMAPCFESIPTELQPKLGTVALRALEQILDTKVSELAQLWAESKPQPWRTAIAELRSRLTQSPTR